MIAVFSKKRLLSLLMLGLVGLVLLILGLRGGISWPTKADDTSQVELPIAQFSEPAATSVNIDQGVGDIATALPAVTAEADFFVDYRLERDRTRGQQVEWLREVINNDGTASETRQKAQESLLAISRNIEKESALENLIRAKGFTDAAVLVDSSTATAVVAATEISTGDIGVVMELMARITGLSPGKIAVIGKK